jgi:uncharacterized membrane protein
MFLHLFQEYLCEIMDRRNAPSKLAAAAAAADDDVQVFATLPEDHMSDPLFTVAPIVQGKLENCRQEKI